MINIKIIMAPNRSLCCVWLWHIKYKIKTKLILNDSRPIIDRLFYFWLHFPYFTDDFSGSLLKTFFKESKSSLYHLCHTTLRVMFKMASIQCSRKLKPWITMQLIKWINRLNWRGIHHDIIDANCKDRYSENFTLKHFGEIIPHIIWNEILKLRSRNSRSEENR